MSHGRATTLDGLTATLLERYREKKLAETAQKANAALLDPKKGWVNWLMTSFSTYYADKSASLFRSSAIPKDAAKREAFFTELKQDLRDLFSRQNETISDKLLENTIASLKDPSNPIAKTIARFSNQDRILAAVSLYVLAQKYSLDIPTFQKQFNSISAKEACFGKDSFYDYASTYCNYLLTEHCNNIRQFYNDSAAKHHEKMPAEINEKAVKILLSAVESYLSDKEGAKAQALYNEFKPSEMLINKRNQYQGQMNTAFEFLQQEMRRSARAEANDIRHSSESYNDYSVDEEKLAKKIQAQIDSNILKFTEQAKEARASFDAATKEVEIAYDNAFNAVQDRHGTTTALLISNYNEFNSEHNQSKRIRCIDTLMTEAPAEVLYEVQQKLNEAFNIDAASVTANGGAGASAGGSAHSHGSLAIATPEYEKSAISQTPVAQASAPSAALLPLATVYERTEMAQPSAPPAALLATSAAQDQAVVRASAQAATAASSEEPTDPENLNAPVLAAPIYQMTAQGPAREAAADLTARLAALPAPPTHTPVIPAVSSRAQDDEDPVAIPGA
ncbi:MAG: hypothetical protein K0S29_436 [Gammaproteobacteria bacterium]|jgi:hypothetical protein|nr:hypothetical protein [Gammaproteobacteria bacterium]